MRRRLEEAEERYELLLAVGLLQWRDPMDTPVRRHLLAAPAEIVLDAARGLLTVVPAASFERFRIELDMLDLQHQPSLDRGTEESHPVDLSSSRSVLHEDSSTNLSGTERRIVDLSDLEDIASNSGLSPEAGRLLVVAATETVAHWALRGHRAVDQMIAQIRVAEGEQRWKLMRPYFATVYEDVRDTFEDEPWVGEMTPEDEVEAAMAAAEATHSGLDPELIASFAEYVTNATAYHMYRGVRKA